MKKENKSEFKLVETYKEFKEKYNYNDPNHSIYYKFIKRPISYPLTWLIFKTNLTPNVLTFLGILSAIISALFFSSPTYTSAVLGVIFFFIFELFDDFDGIIARSKNMRSRRGYWLDVLAGDTGRLLVVGGISVGVFQATANPLYLILGILSLIFLASADNLQHVTKLSFAVVQQRKLTYEEVKPDLKTLAGKISYLAEIAGNLWFILLFVLGLTNHLLWFVYFNLAYYFAYSLLLFLYLNHKHRME